MTNTNYFVTKFVNLKSSISAGLPITLAASFWRLTFCLHWPLCTFINYIYLLTYLLQAVFNIQT